MTLLIFIVGFLGWPNVIAPVGTFRSTGLDFSFHTGDKEIDAGFRVDHVDDMVDIITQIFIRNERDS